LIVSPFLYSAKTGVGKDHPVGVELDNEISLDLDEPSPISGYSAAIEVSYEGELIEVTSSSEFDLEGLSGEEVLFGIGTDEARAEFELEFDPEKTELESYGLTGRLQLDTEASIGLDYESDYPAGEETTETELVIDLARKLTEEILVEIEGTFEEADRQFDPVPEETELDLSGINWGRFTFNPQVEFEETDLEEIDLDYEGEEGLTGNTGLTFEGSVSWSPEDNYLEFDPEFPSRFGTFYLETVLHLKDESQIVRPEINEAGLTDVKFGGLDFEISNDFESGESELSVEREGEPLEAEFELEIRPEEGDTLFDLAQLTGEITWEPDRFLAVSLETEANVNSPPELSLASEYSF
jgi:hypothetical protein